MHKYFWILLISLVFSTRFAGAVPMATDASHSGVEFQVKHLATNVTGRFTDFSGSFDFDASKPENLKDVQFKIVASTINTSNAKRDDHLKSEDFFDVKKFPEILFAGKSVKKKNKNKLELAGDLTLRGVTKAVVWDVDYLGKTENPFVKGEEVFSFTAKTKINRKDYNILWNKSLDKGGFVVGDDVTITVNVEANPKPNTADTAKK